MNNFSIKLFWNRVTGIIELIRIFSLLSTQVWILLYGKSAEGISELAEVNRSFESVEPQQYDCLIS